MKTDTTQVEPQGLPLYWRHEQSGRLAEAVETYLADRLDDVPITQEQIVLLRDYLDQWIHAACWTEFAAGAGWQAEYGPVLFCEEVVRPLMELRRDVKRLTTADAIDEWIHRALDIGIDPL